MMRSRRSLTFSPPVPISCTSSPQALGFGGCKSDATAPDDSPAISTAPATSQPHPRWQGCMIAPARPSPPQEVLMTKSQLVAKVAEVGGVSRKQAEDLLTSLTETVVKTVKRGESVKIPGLGIFRLRRMKARMGRNPQTGEAIKIPARKKVGFSVAKAFKETVLGRK